MRTFHVALTGDFLDADGRIVSDHSYLNRRDWPGISELLGESGS